MKRLLVNGRKWALKKKTHSKLLLRSKTRYDTLQCKYFILTPEFNILRKESVNDEDEFDA